MDPVIYRRQMIQLGCILLTAFLVSCRSIYSYKQNDGRIPAIQLEWLNQDAEDRIVYTGDTELVVRVRMQSEVQDPYTLHFSYRDGYTYQRVILPVHFGKAQTYPDTTYRFRTKKYIPAYEDGHIQVNALVRMGKYGSVKTERYDLGNSLDWMVNAGNCLYSDGSGNITEFGSIEWHYKPIRPEDSGTGQYSGGEELKKKIASAEKDSLMNRVREIVRDTASHRDRRTKGTGLLMFRHHHWQAEYIIDATSPQKTAFECFLKKVLQKDTE